MMLFFTNLTNLYPPIECRGGEEFFSSAQLKTVFFENDFLSLFPEIFLLVLTVVILLYGSIQTTSPESRYPIVLGEISWLGCLTLLWTFFLLIANPITNGLIFYNTLVLDDWGLFLKCFLLFGAFLSIFISIDYLKQESVNNFEYIILLLLSTASMLFLISAADLISMYLAIELQSLSFYVMAACKRNSEFSTEAGLKYFLLGAFSSGLLLWGCSMIYGFTGITNFSDLSQFLTLTSLAPEPIGFVDSFSSTLSPKAPYFFAQSGLTVGILFILVGFLFKMTAVPFHMWAPDVYEGAPTSVTAFFSIAPKISLIGVFVRIFLESFYDLLLPWQTILILSSLASMTLGAFAAMSQNKIKRLLAFSSIGHVGYMLIGLCCGTIEGLQGLLVYLAVYVIMTANLFSVILSPIRRGLIHSVQRVKYTYDLSFLGKTNPLLAGTVTIILFSLAGIPPLAGFFSKAFLFFAAINSNMYLLAIIGVLSSVVSCFYYIRVIKSLYFEKPTSWCSFSRIARENSLAMGVTFFFILFFIFFPSPLFLACHKMVFCLSF